MPQNVGVCADLIIRAYRGVGVDLQMRVHEDMLFKYPITGHYRYLETGRPPAGPPGGAG